jgi:hypothetical protein
LCTLCPTVIYEALWSGADRRRTDKKLWVKAAAAGSAPSSPAAASNAAADRAERNFCTKRGKRGTMHLVRLCKANNTMNVGTDLVALGPLEILVVVRDAALGALASDSLCT